MLDLDCAGFIQELRDGRAARSPDREPRRHGGRQHIPIEDREAFKYALAATLVKNNAHWRAFETVFEVYFSLRGPQYKLDEDADGRSTSCGGDDAGADAPGRGPGRAAAAMDSLTPEELAEMLYQALMNGDDALMRAMARQAVQRYAGMEPGRPVGGTYYLYRTLRNLDLDGVLERLMEASARAGRRRADAARGAARARRVREPHRAVQEGDRGRDPAPAGGRPGRRGHGQDAAQAAARRRRLHARQPRRDGSRCARRCTR